MVVASISGPTGMVFQDKHYLFSGQFRACPCLTIVSILIGQFRESVRDYVIADITGLYFWPPQPLRQPIMSSSNFILDFANVH